MIILLVCAALTVLIETPFMFLMGYRKRDEVALILCVNVVTNLLLNLSLGFLFGGGSDSALIYLFEAAVVAVEYILYSLAFGASMRLFLITLAANCLSYCLGLLIF